MDKVSESDTVILLDLKSGKKYYLNLSLTKGEFNTDKGKIELSSLIGLPYGSTVKSSKGFDFLVLPCTLFDFIMHKLKRLTQIIYPKDAAYILLKLNVKPGDVVLESGVGSGALTAVFAQAVGREGRVISYERREEFIKNASSNLRKLGLLDRVEIKHRDIADGVDEREVDALFLDVREPWLYLDRVVPSLKVGGVLGLLLPTTNQVVESLKKVKELPLIDIEVCEILLRKYKTVPERFRPEDRMPAHTAYLLFARKIPEGVKAEWEE